MDFTFKKKLLSIEKKTSNLTTNLEYEVSSSNDFVAHVPMFTKLDSNLLLLFSIFDTI